MSAWTLEREAKVLARCEAATEGPWEAHYDEDGGEWEVTRPISLDGPGDVVVSVRTWEPGDAAFLANAREDLPDALAEIARLRALLAGVKTVRP